MEQGLSDMSAESGCFGVLMHTPSYLACILAFRPIVCTARLAEMVDMHDPGTHVETSQLLNEAGQVPPCLHVGSLRICVHHRMTHNAVRSQAHLSGSNSVMHQQTPSAVILSSVPRLQSVWWVYSTATAAHAAKGIANFNSRAVFDLLCEAARVGVGIPFQRATDIRYGEYRCAIAFHGMRKQDHSKRATSLGSIIAAVNPSKKEDIESVKATLSQTWFTFDFVKCIRWWPEPTAPSKAPACLILKAASILTPATCTERDGVARLQAASLLSGSEAPGAGAVSVRLACEGTHVRLHLRLAGRELLDFSTASESKEKRLPRQSVVAGRELLQAK